MTIRERIWHYLFGEGTVVESKNRGLYLIVQFRDDIKRLVRGEDVQEFTDRDNGHRIPGAITPSENNWFGVENAFHRSIIEALRLGIVPYGAVRDFTFGRDNEMLTIQKWLDGESTGPLIIRSGYGSGKSHLLDYTRAIGFDSGFAVAMVELDPKETPPYRPKLIYRRLLQSFRYKDNAGRERGFRDFVFDLVNSGKDSDHLDYLHWIVSLLEQGYDDRDIWDWIEGQPGYYCFPTLYDHGTAANIYCHILSEIAWATENRLGLKGLLLILDEAENINQASEYQQTKGWHFIRGLMMLAANDERLKKETVQCNFDNIQIGRYFGEKTNLIYSGHRTDLRYCLNSDITFKVAFAFTNKDMEAWLNDWKVLNTSIELEQLPDIALATVFKHICISYESAYKYHIPEEVYNKAFEAIKKRTRNRANLTRSFVKGSVETLDILRFNPGLSPDNIR
jgi:hypothetical protein